jgi:hypothetical protein
MLVEKVRVVVYPSIEEKMKRELELEETTSFLSSSWLHNIGIGKNI